MALAHFASGRSLPALPPELCELVRRRVGWMHCGECGARVVREERQMLVRLTADYVVRNGHTVCVPCLRRMAAARRA